METSKTRMHISVEMTELGLEAPGGKRNNSKQAMSEIFHSWGHELAHSRVGVGLGIEAGEGDHSS